MKRTLYILLTRLLLLAGIVSCTDDTLVQENTTLENGDVKLKVTAHIPEPKQVITRDIDPDGLGVNTLWLFCFNRSGEYIGRREAGNFQPADSRGYYSFEVEIPGATRIIHFLSNVYLDDFNDRDNFGRNETTVIPSFISASGRMCYWGRKEFSNAEELETFSTSGNVTLYRNQAQVCWEIPQELKGTIQVYGYAICNRRAWGTIAPFDADAAQNGQNPFNFEEVYTNFDNLYITEPTEEYQILASDPTTTTVQGDKNAGDPHYIFENPNTLDAPVYAIMHIGVKEGGQETRKFYKIMFVDENKKQLPIYRNYKYVIRITGLPDAMGYEGENGFVNAKNGVAANNAWVSVDPEIAELTDGTNTLNITEGTTQVFTEGGNQTIDFTYNGNDNVEVSWVEDGEEVSDDAPILTHTGNNYEIELDLKTPTDNPQVRTLLLHAGVFTRQIKVYLVKPFSFEPVWVSTGVPMSKGEPMSMTFVIPDNYPAELFPIECKIATNKMNANDDLGEQLPIIIEDCNFHIADENGDGNDENVSTTWGYKYVYTATQPGIQEVFFTLNTSDGKDQGVTWNGGNCEYGNQYENHGHVFLQAENFNDAHRLVLFQDEQTNRRIAIENHDTDNPGFRTMNIAPTINQPITITLNFKANDRASAPQRNTIMRVATAVAKPTDDFYLSPEECASLGLPTNNNIVTYYYYEFENNRTESLMLHFVTNTSDVEDIIRFSIDKENGLNPDLDEQYLYKSAGVELKANPERFTFDGFTVGDNNTARYGLNQPVDISFSIPQEAVQYNDATFFIATKNLVPASGNIYELNEAEGGYNFTIPQGSNVETVTLHFQTNRIANGETVTINAIDNTALFAPASATFTNRPIRGTITLAGDDAKLATNSFITLERKNGTRVGIITVESVDDDNNVASYQIDLRSEYDFTMDEELTIYYNALNPDEEIIYQETRTFQTLVNDAEDDGEVSLIILKKR
ncbi:putative uncharacterized protein [Bacteroides sp. CAG:702]|nr:putative uncharacterized protein [Bacteroides sp. CAG:702]